MKAGPTGLAAAFCGVLFAALVISGSAAGTSQDSSIFRRNAAFAEGDGLAGFEYESFLSRQASGSCLDFPTYERSVLFINNTADDSILGLFYPEEGTTVDDYTFRPSSSNDFVLEAGDTDLQIVEVEVNGQIAYNISIDFSFNKCAGITNFGLTVERNSDSSTFCSATFDYLVAGFCIYTDVDGEKTVYTGKDGDDTWSMDYTSLLTTPGVTFHSFFQYLDRSNSTNPIPANPSISDIVPEFSGRTSLIRYNSDSCNIAGGSYDGTVVANDEGCYQQFSVNQPGDSWPGVFYGVTFTQYISGSITIVYVWDSFTTDSEFDGSDEEPYMTYITLTVTGAPPPVVIQIVPDVAFQNVGGEKVTVYYLNTFNAQSRPLEVATVGSYALDVVIQNTEDMQIVNYTVAPGEGINLDWFVDVTTEAGETVRAIDLTEPPYKFDYYGLISLDPTVGPETGGIPITACAFPIANFDRERDQILFGGTPVPSEYITEDADGNCITFTLPPRFVIDEPFVYDVFVVVDGERTFLDTFTYLPEEITVSIIPSGPSQDSNNGTIWNLPPCIPSSYLGVITPGFVNTDQLQRRWEVVDLETGAIVPLSDDGASSIDFNGFDLEAGKDYQMTLEATFTVGDFTRSGSDTIIIRKGTSPGLGVDVLPIVPRGVTDPDQPLRVFVRVFFPEGDECPFSINSTALEFLWTYNGVEAPVFSAESTAIDESGRTPTKLGREYVVQTPQLFMGANDVSCLVTLRDDPSITGSDTESVNIEQRDIEAVINGGVCEMVAYNSADLKVTGDQSWDPNVADADAQKNDLEYSWTCKKGTSPTSFPDDCGSQGASTDPVYTISSGDLGGVLDGESQVYMQLTLTASKGGVSGTSTVVVDLRDNGDSLPADPTVIIGDQTFKRYMHDKVPFYRNVQILPSTTTFGSTVSYEIVEPAFETDISKFTTELSGYWYPGNPQNDLSTLGILIPDDALLPDVTYKFKLTFTGPGTSPRETYVCFRTVAEPQVVLLDMPVKEGTNDTMFSAQAVSTVDVGDTYKYYFYLTMADGREVCLDGCMGQSTAQFKIPYAGTYGLRVELKDALGYHLASSDSTSGITVTAEGAGSLHFDTFEELFYAGDANQYELNALFLGALWAPGTDADEETISQVADIIRGMVRIVSLSFPEPEMGAAYCGIAAAILKLPTTTVSDLSTVYGAWGVFNSVMTNTPENEKLVILEQSQQAMNYSRKHVLSASAQGTSRQRLVRQDVNGGALDWYELTQRTIVTANTRGAACGTTQTASTAIEGGDADSGESLGSDCFELTTATSCFAGQVQQISATEGSTYSWCEAIYDEAQVGRRHLSLMESPEIIFESGVAGNDPENKTQSLRLVQSNIWVEQDGLVGLKPVIDYESECYNMDIRLQDDAVRPGPNILYPPKQYGMDVTVGIYGAYVADQKVTSNSKANDQRIAFASRIPGVVSIRPLEATTSTPTPEVGNPGGGGLSGGAIAGIVVGILIFIVIAVVVSWLIASRCLLVTATPPPPLELDETFVERDVYGRSMWANEMGMNSTMA